MYKAKVIEVINSNPRVVLVRLKFDEKNPFQHKPGQFIRVFVPKDGKLVFKPYSIATPPSVRDYIELCIKIIPHGYVSNYMARLRPEQEILVDGPHGNFVLHEAKRDIVFLATGTGISAIRPMIDAIFEKGFDKKVWLFFGVKHEKDIIYRKHFEELAEKNENFYFVPCLSRASREWKGEKGYVQNVMKKFVEEGKIDFKNSDVYICGVIEAVKDGRTICEEIGFPKERIFFEVYV